MPDPKNPPRVEEPQAAYDPVTAGVHAVQQLEQAGFNRPQAESVVAAVRELAGDLATKEDLAIVKNELRAEMADLKGELRAEMADLKGELRAEIAAVEGRLNGEILAIKKTMATKEDLAQMQIQQAKDAFRHTMWTVGIIVGTFLAGMGVATAVLIAVMTRLLPAA